MTPALERGSRPESARVLILMGTLWLVLATSLLIYRVTKPHSVSIEWDTATEVEAAGFYLYRSETADGQYALVNEDLIPSRGSALTGASYTYVDTTVQPGHSYFYLLEEVEFDSSRNRYLDDVFSYTVPNPWLVYLVSAIGMLVGIVLLMSGLKEG